MITPNVKFDLYSEDFIFNLKNGLCYIDTEYSILVPIKFRKTNEVHQLQGPILCFDR